MKNAITPILIAGFVVLITTFAIIYSAIFLLPEMMDHYYESIFRTSSFQTDLLFYLHPFILSISLYWFWNKLKSSLNGSAVSRAIQLAFTFGFIAMLPVFWITFSSLNISLIMVLTWLGLGIAQSFVAGIVFSKMNP